MGDALDDLDCKYRTYERAVPVKRKSEKGQKPLNGPPEQLGQSLAMVDSVDRTVQIVHRRQSKIWDLWDRIRRLQYCVRYVVEMDD